MAMAARMPMMIMTTSSSMSVKPLSLFSAPCGCERAWVSSWTGCVSRAGSSVPHAALREESGRGSQADLRCRPLCFATPPRDGCALAWPCGSMTSRCIGSALRG
jgi:hypothetical protein